MTSAKKTHLNNPTMAAIADQMQRELLLSLLNRIQCLLLLDSSGAVIEEINCTISQLREILND
jgi:hypothetical protein